MQVAEGVPATIVREGLNDQRHHLGVAAETFGEVDEGFVADQFVGIKEGLLDFRFGKPNGGGCRVALNRNGASGGILHGPSFRGWMPPFQRLSEPPLYF